MGTNNCCPICLVDLDDSDGSVFVYDCCHAECSACALASATNQIESRKCVRCAMCRAIVMPPAIERLFSDSSHFHRRLCHLAMEILHRNNHVRVVICPYRGCRRMQYWSDSQLIRSRFRPPRKDGAILCCACAQPFCARCQSSVHPLFTCDTFSRNVLPHRSGRRVPTTRDDPDDPDTCFECIYKSIADRARRQARYTECKPWGCLKHLHEPSTALLCISCATTRNLPLMCTCVAKRHRDEKPHHVFLEIKRHDPDGGGPCSRHAQ